MERAGRAGGAGKNKNDLLPKEKSRSINFSLGSCSNVVVRLAHPAPPALHKQKQGFIPIR
jgi:hypothetical protein